MTPDRLRDEASAGVSWLRGQAPAGTPLFLLGFSLGTGVAAEFAAAPHQTTAGLILCQPYTSLREAAGRVASLLGPLGRIFPMPAILHSIPDVWRTKDGLERVPCPLLLVHAEGDALFPATMARALHAAAPIHAGEAANLHLVRGLHHNALYQLVPAAYWDPILSFILRLADAESARLRSADGTLRDPGLQQGDGRDR